MGRKPKRRATSSPEEQRRAGRFSSQLFVWRYWETHWWMMSEGFEFRGLVPAKQQAAAHNLALYARNHWHVYSITYLRDANGKLYREFSYHRTQAQITGSHDGVSFLMKEAMNAGEANLNPKHIYGRAMVFAPWTKAYPSLVPILKRKKDQLRLTDEDVAAMAEHEKEVSMVRSLPLPERPEPPAPVEIDIDEQIAALLPPEKEKPVMPTPNYEAMFRAFGHPVRFSIMRQLRDTQARVSPSQLAEKLQSEGLKVSQSGLSQHLKVLRDADMVKTIRHQTGSEYFRNPQSNNPLISALNELSE